MERAVACGVVAIVAALAAGCSKAPAPAGSAGLAVTASVSAPAATASTPEPGVQAPDEALAWLEGRWCGSDDDQRIEETWFAPKQDETTGMSRTISGGRVISFEYMRIASLDGVQTLLAQPDGNLPTKFARTDGGQGWIRFENKQHDYPQRIEYKREGDELTAEIGGPGAEGKEEVISYRYAPCKA
jgi:hypothetical protein